MLAKNKRLIIIFIAIPCLLLIPLIAMRFTSEVDWALGDFLVMGILLCITGLLVEFVIRMVKKSTYRPILIAVIVILFLLVWAELGVGIFGTPFAGN